MNGPGLYTKTAERRYIIRGYGVDHVFDVSDVAKHHLAIALLVVAGGDDVVAVAEPGHVGAARALMALQITENKQTIKRSKCSQGSRCEDPRSSTRGF